MGGNTGTGNNDLTIEITEIEATDKSVKDQTLTGVATYPVGAIGQILTSTLTGDGKFEPLLGIIATDATGKPEIEIDATSSPAAIISSQAAPDLIIEVQEDAIEKSIGTLDTEIQTTRADIIVKKNALITTTSTQFTSLSTYQEKKLKTMNMSLVLYDEVPEYAQASQDAIKGNTYSRIQNCQFKRI